MHKKELITIFESALDKTGVADKQALIERLDSKLNKSNYDVQDCSFIEIIINEDRKEFEQSFSDLLNEINKDHKNRDECIEETVNLFIQSLEHSIDYYYNSIIARHFSSS